jgi:hypothetical protein
LVRSGSARAAIAIALALTVIASPGAALAQPSMKDRFEADRLFREGKQLYGEGKYDEACQALATSDELDPAIGTLGLLAACHEKRGDLLAAWKGYLETKRRADAKRDSRGEYATEQAAAVKARLARLTIRSLGNELDLEVTRDGVGVPASLLGVEVPLNPGEHTITARVLGAKDEQDGPAAQAWKTSVSLKEGEARTVEIPALGLAAGSASSGPPRWLAFVVGGAGLAGIGVGAVAGSIAISNNTASMNKTTCSPIAKECSERDAAFTAATISTIGFVVGGAAVAAGVVLFFVSDAGSPAPLSGAQASGLSIHLAPSIGPSSAGVILGGTF